MCSLEKNNILLVEDDKIDQMAFERFINKNELPYDYSIAGSVSEAKEYLKKKEYDVVLLDYLLGDGTAFDVFSLLKGTPVIFITGGGNELIAVKAIKQGAFDYLIKDHERNYLSLLSIVIQKAISHKIAEEKWRKAEEERARLSWVLSKTENAIVITDKEGKITWANDGFARMTGYSLKNVKNTHGELLRRGNKTGITPGVKLYETVYVKKKPVSYEAKNFTKDGEEFWAFTTLTPMLDDNGNIQEVVAIDSDITKRKLAEQELRDTTTRLITLLDNLIVGVLFIDSNDTVIHINKKYCEIFSLKMTPNDLRGKPSSQLNARTKLRFNQPDEYTQRIEQIVKDNKPVLKEELQLSDKKMIERSFIPIKYSGIVRSRLWIYSDITQRKKVEQELRKAKKTAEQSSKAKEQFLANISHEIRTPMNAIIGLGQLLTETSLDAKQMEYQKAINFAADNLMVLINDVLDLSKIEAGKISFEETDFNLRELTKALVDTVSFRVDMGKLKLKTKIDPEIPSVLIGDPVRLNQILLNIVGNSIKFTNEGEVGLLIKVLKKEKNKVTLKFSVKDTGIGIPEDKLQVIFDAFNQAKSDTTRKYGGTGLGLAIVKQLIDLQKGSISVKSKVDKGTTFSFLLDFKIAEPGKKNNKQKSELITTFDLKGKKVLLVEDNELNQMLAETFLKKWGLEVQIAENGRIAIEILEKNAAFDLILMDIQMPEMDGYEATEHIRKHLAVPGKNIPILAMTAHAFKHEEEKCLRKGMNSYVSKPLKPDMLYHKIAEVLKKESEGRECKKRPN